MKIVAFSDWRRKSVGDILKYLHEMPEIPDLIAYAGDYISQFNVVESEMERMNNISLSEDCISKQL